MYKTTTLHRACMNDNLHRVKFLVEDEKMDVNQVDSEGGTPLLDASRLDKISIVRFLVEEGKADVNKCDNYGHSPLSAALESRAWKVRLEVIVCLLAYGSIVPDDAVIRSKTAVASLYVKDVLEWMEQDEKNQRLRKVDVIKYLLAYEEEGWPPECNLYLLSRLEEGGNHLNIGVYIY